MTRKVKNCYGCPADNGHCGCLLKYERVSKYEIFNKVSLLIYSPVKPCHKPKSYKEFMKRWNYMHGYSNELIEK